MKSKRKKIMACFAVAFLTFCIWLYWSNVALKVDEYEITNGQIPEAFSGFRIVQISDLHNAEFGEGNEGLLSLLAQTAPDIIVITGDLIDSRHTDVEIALDFCESAIEFAPVYYVTGNHEARIPEYEELKIGLIDAGVIVLENEKMELTREGERITLIGLRDPSFQTEYLFGDEASVTQYALGELQNASDGFTILLSHRPESFDIYVDAGVDLVFSGHAHGGQFRLPFIGGLVAPNQGFFPEYDAGLFSKENTTMIVSRGVGNSIIPIRFNNRPEIIVAVLRLLA